MKNFLVFFAIAVLTHSLTTYTSSYFSSQFDRNRLSIYEFTPLAPSSTISVTINFPRPTGISPEQYKVFILESNKNTKLNPQPGNFSSTTNHQVRPTAHMVFFTGILPADTNTYNVQIQPEGLIRSIQVMEITIKVHNTVVYKIVDYLKSGVSHLIYLEKDGDVRAANLDGNFICF